MKHILQLTSFLLLLAMVFSTCELPEQDNPWDENTKRDPDSWAPEKLTVEDISITSKKISWSYSGDTRIEGFQIERKENQGDWGNTIKISDNQASEWVDENIVPDTAITYTYRLVAIAGVNKSTETSTSVKVTFPGLTNLNVGVSNDTIVSLNWDYSATGHEGFKIDKRKANEAWQTGYSTLSNDLKTFTDNEKTLPEHPYYYRVYAYYKNYSSVPMTDSIIFPTVTTTSPSQIETTSAIGGGTVTSGANVTARGVVWSTSQNPTVSLTTKTNNGAGTGPFTSSLTGLLPSTTYYVRAYATNHFGTAYGNQLSFTTATPAMLAILTTNTISNLTTNSATSGGNITSDGGATVTSRGVVWSTLQNPTTTLSTKTIDGSGTGTFSSSLSNLTPSTTYYVRAYAINSAGTSYGNQISFTTSTPISSPVLNTISVSNITTTTASSGGNITSDGGSSITTRGVVWSTSQNPTVSLSTKTNNGTGTGSFSSSLTGLSPSTTYYVRAYATSLFGTAYGNQVSFTTSTPITVPVLTTLAATDITTSSASSGGNVSSDGGASVTARGVVWSTSQNPTVSLSTKSSNGTGTGSFVSSITALSPSTTYYVRAYASNSEGTGYGSQVSFTTNEQFVTTVVEVLNPATGMTWMDRNLGASRAATSNMDGEAFGDLYQWGRGSDGHEKRSSPTTTSLSSSNSPGHGNFIVADQTPYDWRSAENNNLWQGVSGTNNPCPDGFRLPTEAEWESERSSWVINDGIGAHVSPLKLTAAGARRLGYFSIIHTGSYGYYWSSTVMTQKAIGLVFGSTASTEVFEKANGFSVRCIKNGTSVSLPSLSTSTISSITTSSASSGGTITSDGGAAITSRGVVWSTSQNPTVSLSTKTSNGTGTGSFTSSITGLSPGTNYYVRAYATNSMGTSYGNQVSFTTNEQFVTTVVEVFNPATGRNWMDRNLGASRAGISSTDSQAYGDLYQWGRDSDGHEKRNSETTSVLSSSNTPGHGMFILNSFGDWRSPQNNNLWQGENGINNPCPAGFRIPTSAEWEAERSSWSNKNSAGAFASPLKLPVAGVRFGGIGSIGGAGSFGSYWSSTLVETDAKKISIHSDYANIYSDDRNNGYSVRCIKDAVEITLPYLSTSSISSITNSSARSGGNVTFGGGVAVTSRGVVWSTTQNPTVSLNTKTSNGNGIGSFTSSITGLSPSTTYYVRAYATNSAGTAYGNQMSFTTYATFTVSTVTSTTGKVWLDRNLGASRVASSSTDNESFGDLYQWGRDSDGHEKRTSQTTSSLSSSDTPDHDIFITTNYSTGDWRSPQNNNLWQAENGTNNPCPEGFRIPTAAEWEAELASWSSKNSAGAFASPLKLPVSGSRYYSDGSLGYVGSIGYCWSGTVNGTYAQALYFYSSSVSMISTNRANGFSVRCLKD